MDKLVTQIFACGAEGGCLNPEIFSEWLRHQHHTVFQTKSSYWVDFGPRVYQAFPYHWIIDPPEMELSEILKGKKGIGLRYSTMISAPYGVASYHAVYEAYSYDFDLLSKWARKNVRRGLKHCLVEPITFSRLASEGFALQVDTLARQGRRLSIEEEVWRTRCLSAGALPGFEAWGAIVGGKLAASVITFQMNDWIYMLYQQCHREYLAQNVNNALSFVVTRTMIERPHIKAILYGLHSLDAPPSVDEFKFRMGYNAKPVRQRVAFHPWLRPLVNPASHAFLQAALRLRPGDSRLSKAEGMLRFCLQGALPLAQQVKPEPLRETLRS
jgi:hypothetical protein